jgi:hypothetical protein
MMKGVVQRDVSFSVSSGPGSAQSSGRRSGSAGRHNSLKMNESIGGIHSNDGKFR